MEENPAAAHDLRRTDQDRTLSAMHQLEAALGSAAPGREPSWRAQVLAALAVLDDATNEEYHNANRPDSLMSDIKRTQPGLRTRVRGLRSQYAGLRHTISSLSDELMGSPGRDSDFADVRERLSWLLTAIRHQRARESDLIYEAYYDAFDAELDVEADNAPREAEAVGEQRE